MMAFDAYKILDELETGSMIDLIAPCMDDYLYIIDLKNDTLRISQSAVERFMLPDRKSTRLNSSHSGQSRMPSSA